MWKFLARPQLDSGTLPTPSPAAAAEQGPVALGRAGGAAAGSPREEDGAAMDMGDVEDHMAEVSSPPRPARLPSVALSPDAGMLWEVLPPMGISPAVPFLTGHMLHSSSGDIPPPPPASLAMPPVLGLGAEALGGGGSSGPSHKSPRPSPAILMQMQVCCGC